MFENIPHTFQLFLHSLAGHDGNNINCLLNECVDVDSIKEEEAISIILMLLQSWGSKYGYNKNKNVRWSTIPLTCEQITDIVQALKVEQLFVKVFLLLPNKIKDQFVTDMKEISDKNKNQDAIDKLGRVLLKSICTNDKALFTQGADGLSKLNLQVCKTTLLLADLAEENHGLCCLLLMFEKIVDRILASENNSPCIKYSRSNDADPNYNKRINLPNSISNNTVDIDFIKRCVQCKESALFFKEFVNAINTKLKLDIKNITFVGMEVEWWILFLLKSKKFKYIISTMENEYIENDILDKLIAYFTEHITPADRKHMSNVIGDDSYYLEGWSNSHQHAYHQLIKITSSPSFYKWKSMQNSPQKFKEALQRLSMLYCDLTEISEWLLSSENFYKEHSTEFIDVYSEYVRNFGSTDTVRSVLDVFFKNSLLDNKVFTDALFKVLLNLFPYLSVKACDNLISHCKLYYNKNENLYNMAKVKHIINESLNKIVSHSAEDLSVNQSFLMVAGFCIIHPWYMIQELAERLFAKNLNISVFTKILHTLTSLVDLVHEKYVDNNDPFILVQIEKCYEKNTSYGDNVDSILLNVMISLLKAYEAHNLNANLQASMIRRFKERFNAHALSTVPINISLETFKAFLSSLSNTTKDFLLFEDLIDLTSQLQILLVVNDVNVSIELYECQHIMHKCLGILTDLLEAIYSALSLEERNNAKEKVVAAVSNLNEIQRFRYFSTLNSFGISMVWFLNSNCYDLIGNDVTTARRILPSKGNNIDMNKWETLFRMWIENKEFTIELVSSMRTLNAEIEMEDIIDAFIKMTSPVASLFKMKQIVEGVFYLVENQKLSNYESFLDTDLQSESRLHAASISLFVCIQCFGSTFADAAKINQFDKFNIKNYVLIFHDHMLYAKTIEENKLRSYFLTYFLEQLIFLTSVITQTACQSLILLLKDVLSLAISSSKQSDDHKSFIKMKNIIDQCGNEWLRKELQKKVNMDVS